jgi:hypothetical protein
VRARPTPGPWRTDPECGDQSVLGADGSLVADCCIMGIPGGPHRSVEECEANARLIAAVPAMLSALEFIASQENHAFAECSLAEEIIGRARTAIAKARGEDR